MGPVAIVGMCVGAVLATKKLVGGPHGHHHGGHGGGINIFGGGYSDPYAWAPLAPSVAACPPGYMLDAYGRCIPAVPAQVSGIVGQSQPARYCYGRRVR
jgi:hypothetical protein